jgi:phosphinothricin acetyltransferase
MLIRDATGDDAARIATIYNHFVENSICTFEIDPVSVARMAERVASTRAAGLPWLVAEDNDDVVGFCYAGAWKGRCAYRRTVEATVYVAHAAHGQGWGERLYRQLLAQLAHSGVHAVVCGIALPNPASIALHEKVGMQQVAHFREMGRKFDRWLDIGYWQILLDGEYQG